MNMDDARIDARLAHWRSAVTAAAFAPGFADRVIDRLAAVESRPVLLQRLFFRIAPLAAAAAIVLGAISLRQNRNTGQSLVDRVFGLPAVTLANAYAFEEGR